MSTTPTPRASDYTTEELERLTTLTEETARPGEFARRLGCTGFRTDCSVVYYDGRSGSPSISTLHGPERRVRSFTDATELDPPQEEMLAELERRRVRFRQGDTIVLVDAGTLDAIQGHLATVTTLCRHTDAFVDLAWDTRVSLAGISGMCTRYLAWRFRLATPADIAAFEARIPKPTPVEGQVYHYGAAVDKPYRRKLATGWAHSSSEHGPWVECQRQEWCQEAFDEGRMTPITPTPISNATHAGRRVRHRTAGEGRLLDAWSAKREQRMHERECSIALATPYIWFVSDTGKIDGDKDEAFTLL